MSLQVPALKFFVTLQQKEMNLATIAITKSRIGKDGVVFENCKFNNELLEIDTETSVTFLGFGEQQEERKRDRVKELLEKDTTLRDQLESNTNYFKEGLRKAGIDFIDGDSAIVPVMLYDAKLSQIMADELLKKGIYVIGFFYPVVPKDKARIRVQLSAAHTKEHLDKAINAFAEVSKSLKTID